MAQHAPARLGLRAMADLATPMAVRTAATLRVADHLTGEPRTAADLAAAIGADTDALDRLLRHLVTLDLLVRDREGRYGLTDFGQQLRDDHPAGRRKWLDMDGAVGKGDLSFIDLLHTVRTGDPAYPVRFGLGFWDDLAADPALSASFDDLMGHHQELDNPELMDLFDWAALGHVVDVGGGSGALLAALLGAHPELRGTLVDLAGPVAAARRRFAELRLAGRAEAVEGSFFEQLPAGAGGYVLSAIIHDWADEPAVAILRRCAEAAGEKGAVLVIEAIGADGESPSTTMDLRMLAYCGGRERGLDQLRALGARAGLAVRAVHPYGYMSVVEFRAA
ncbi:methyltransferase [Kitasatospora sp. NPDC049285]|uniref:methyltransferase n=1 Tax=Kitasatospora sp. NPDC049285 TaxID=3157096 RepID=UPI00341F5D6C